MTQGGEQRTKRGDEKCGAKGREAEKEEESEREQNSLSIVSWC